MTRASDLTYLFRSVFVTWTFGWFLQHVWNLDRFEALRWRRVKRFELKSAITILLCIMCPLQATYDIVTSKIKYTEGFMVIPYTGDIITKPVEFWNDENLKLVTPINYILCANFSAQTCLLFLLQSFWNYLANNIAKTTFMGSFEFKSYIIYSIFSMALFPLLQWLYRYDSLLTEVVPQFAYGVILLIIALLGVRSHWRFTRLLRITRSANSSQLSIVLKLEYFKEMNRYLTWGLFIGATSMIILCVDAFTPQKYINSHKFSQDLLFCHINFTIWIVFVSLCLIFYPSSNTLNDSLTMAKGIASSITDKSKGNFLGPPNSRFSKYNPNNEDSSWSSNGSSRNDRTSFYLDVHDDVSARNNNQNRSSSRPTSVTFDIPPLPNSVTFDPLSPNPPPSVYNSSISRDPENSSPFYFTSNTLLPSPALLPSTLSTEQQSSTNLPSSITITPEHSNISNNSNNNRRSLTFSKPLPTEPLQYPSSPLTKINRNSLSSLTSMENQFSTGISSPSHNQDISPLISSQSTRENSKDSLNSDDDLAYMSRKNARMSIISNNDKPIIKVTTSTTSFKLSTDLTDDENFIDDNLQINKKINNNKFTKFGKNEKKKKKVTLLDGDQKASKRFQQRQEELLKQKQKSLALMIGENGNNDFKITNQVNQFTQINHGLNDNYNNSKILSSPTSPKYITDCTITPRSSSLIHAPRKVKTHNNLKTDVIDVVEMVKLNSPTFSNSSPKSPSPLLISPISPSSSSTTSSMSPTTPINDDSKNLLSSQLPIIPNSKTTTKVKSGILKNSKNTINN